MFGQEKATSFLKKYFTIEKNREASLASGALRRFIHGLAIYDNYVIPLPFILVVNSIMLSLLLTENMMKIANINWFDKFVEYNLCYPAVLYSILVTKNRRDLIYISESIDVWWNYQFLEKKTEMVKKRADAWLKRFTNAYRTFMIMGYLCVFFQPIGKYIWNGGSDMKDLMLFKCWSPVPLDKTWGLMMILVLEIVAQFFPFFMYSAIACYMITMTILFYHQTHLICEAFATIEERVWKMVWQTIETPNGAYLIYTEILQQEITNCARNYQNLYKYLKKMCKIFNITTNILYYTGMFLLVSSGLHLVTKKTNSLMLFQAVMLISSILVNQYLNSFITETLQEATARLRISVYSCNWYNMPKKCKINIHLMQTLVSYSPKLTTILGARCDKEFLSKVINASYCYFNALYSMTVERNENLH
nr:odorant receptor 23 [Graphosoma rubrolineatum]